MKKYEVRDISLAPSGRQKIEWVAAHMPLLRGLQEEFERDKPFQGVKITLSIHLEAKTAYLCEVLAAGGAEMSVTGSNVLSTQDDVAAALAAAGLRVFAYHGATEEEYRRHIEMALEQKPNIVIDDGEIWWRPFIRAGRILQRKSGEAAKRRQRESSALRPWRGKES